MRRRKFIKVVTASGAVCLLPGLVACDDGEVAHCPMPLYPSDDPFDSWSHPAADVDDIRLVVLGYALLAPNPHNIQPWWVRLRSASEFDILVDPERLLPLTDPPLRQIHIGMGTFLELLSLAATHHGHRADVSYFPEGDYPNTSLSFLPVARVSLVKANEPTDPLFEAILDRRSDKEPYDATPVAETLLQELAATAGDQPARLAFARDPELVANIAQVALDAMDIELSSAARNQETIETWRFTDEELREHRSGFDARFLAEMGLTRELLIASPEAFRAQGVALHESRVFATPAFGWMTTATNRRLDQVVLGRQYARFNLAATAAGLSMHPVSQVLEEYDDMKELQASFKELIGVPEDHTVQMLVRLGYGPKDPVSPRRRWSDFSQCSE